ncbi:MAG: 4Fe-4S binding protein [Clostridia bacterium]
MAKFYAVRNISLCTKDCLCLYVCKTGATDTEDSIIDKNKCIGCGVCANACPSKAISMIPYEMPPQQKHEQDVIKAMKMLFSSKIEQENIASNIPNKLTKAIEKSNRIMAEDIIRETGYMLPQSGNSKAILIELAEKYPELDEITKELLSNVEFNEEIEPKTEKWKCKICGYIHEGEMIDEFTCPICKQPASVFEKI